MDLHRLPELFCGFARRPRRGADAVPGRLLAAGLGGASVFYVLQACLGLSFHPEAPRIRFTHPILPAWLPRLHIGNLRVGDDAVVDLDLERHEHDVRRERRGEDGQRRRLGRAVRTRPPPSPSPFQGEGWVGVRCYASSALKRSAVRLRAFLAEALLLVGLVLLVVAVEEDPLASRLRRRGCGWRCGRGTSGRG